jgi:hypothetical protein
MKTLRLVRLALVAAGVSVAVPAFACGEHEKGKDTNADKSKTEKNDKKDEKKPTNPA